MSEDIIITRRSPSPKKPRLPDHVRLIGWSIIMLCGWVLFVPADQPGGVTMTAGETIAVVGLALIVLYALRTS